MRDTADTDEGVGAPLNIAAVGGQNKLNFVVGSGYKNECKSYQCNKRTPHNITDRQNKCRNSCTLPWVHTAVTIKVL